MEKEKARQEIIRLAETNLDGRKTTEAALRKIKGVSFMFSNAVTGACGFRGRRLGELSEQELKKLEDAITNPGKFGIPSWMYNRKSEPLTGENRHLVASQLEFANKTDINELKKLKCYRGVRHLFGLPVRGQRTRSSFRRGRTVGVRRKKDTGKK